MVVCMGWEHSTVAEHTPGVYKALKMESVELK